MGPQLISFFGLFLTTFGLPLQDEQLELVKRAESSGQPICEWSDGGSSVHWTTSKKGLRFSVTTEAKKGKFWSAIGVGESMGDLKLAIVFTEGGKVKQAGGYKSTGYQPPAKERALKVTLDKKSVKEVNGQMSFDFVAPEEMFAGGDANGCITLQIGINAGQYQGQYNIRKHDNTPTPVQVCNIQKCTSDQPQKEEPEGTETVDGEGSGAEPEKDEAKEPSNPSSTAAPNNGGGQGQGQGQEAAPLHENPLTGDEKAKEGKNEPEPTEKTSRPVESSSDKKDRDEPLTGPKATLDDQEEAKTSGSGSSTLITVRPCRPGHTDLHVCQGYFVDYLGKVEQWAQRHNELMGAQLWKACSLLSGVQHVPTMCCHEFHSTCQQFVQDQ